MRTTTGAIFLAVVFALLIFFFLSFSSNFFTDFSSLHRYLSHLRRTTLLIAEVDVVGADVVGGVDDAAATCLRELAAAAAAAAAA